MAKEKQVAILRALSEGMGIRATERLTDTSRETVLSLLVRAGEGCERLHDRLMVNLPCRLLELDEIWGYVGKHQRFCTEKDDPARVGDFWTWTALDPESKLVPSYRVGKRDGETANAFVADLAARLAGRVQLSSDGLVAYVDAIEKGFGGTADYAQVVKDYVAEPAGEGRYSPPRVSHVFKEAINGSPNMRFATTSHVERLNLSIRMENRRHTRLTLSYSKKLANHKAATALFFARYNLCRVHHSLRVTPAMDAGVADHVWSLEELLDSALAKPEAA